MLCYQILVSKVLEIYAIDINLFSAEQLFKDYSTYLSEKKIKELKAYKHSDAMLSSLLGELVAKYAIAKNFNIPIKEIVFNKVKNGKPIVSGHKNIYFNISHSKNIVICAVSNSVIGIDIESLDRDVKFKSLTKRFFSEQEIKLVNNSTDFLNIWTLKEAYLKAIGTGISGGLQNFTVPYLKEDKTMLINKNPWYFDNKEFNNYIISICQSKKIESNIKIKEITDLKNI